MRELEALERAAASPGLAWQAGRAIPYQGPESPMAYAKDIFWPGEGNLDNYNEGSIKSPSGTTYAMSIVSAAVGPEVVTLFGYRGRVYFAAPAAGITIAEAPGYGPYALMLDMLNANPFQIVSVRFQSDAAQIAQQAYTYVRETAWGHLEQNTLSAATYRTEKDFLNGVISIPVSHPVDIFTYVNLTVLPGSTLDITFFIGARREVSEALKSVPSPAILPGKAGRIAIAGPAGVIAPGVPGAGV